jgi:hypothetical protein
LSIGGQLFSKDFVDILLARATGKSHDTARLVEDIIVDGTSIIDLALRDEPVTGTVIHLARRSW